MCVETIAKWRKLFSFYFLYLWPYLTRLHLQNAVICCNVFVLASRLQKTLAFVSANFVLLLIRDLNDLKKRHQIKRIMGVNHPYVSTVGFRENDLLYENLHTLRIFNPRNHLCTYIDKPQAFNFDVTLEISSQRL